MPRPSGSAKMPQPWRGKRQRSPRGGASSQGLGWPPTKPAKSTAPQFPSSRQRKGGDKEWREQAVGGGGQVVLNKSLAACVVLVAHFFLHHHQNKVCVRRGAHPVTAHKRFDIDTPNTSHAHSHFAVGPYSAHSYNPRGIGC